MGLLEASWGGTRVEAWSSVEVNRRCYHHHREARDEGELGPDPDPNRPAVLWNAMAHPLTRHSAYGFLWCQGEKINFLEFEMGRKCVFEKYKTLS